MSRFQFAGFRQQAIASLILAASFGLSSAASATVCDTDPGAVDFEATVNEETIATFLSALAKIDLQLPDLFLTISGLCTDHRIRLDANVLALLTDAAPFTISPVPGQIQVTSTFEGPYAIGIDGGNYQGVNCSSSCVVEIPYIGEILDGCSVEEGIVGPVLSLLDAGASWDDVNLVQRADTCVTSTCEPVHPTTSSNADLVNFDVDLTGFGSCEICLPFPLDFLGCLDPCQGFDPLIAGFLEDPINDLVSNGFVNQQGEGILIEALSIEIKKDSLGCFDIPEVVECLDGGPAPAMQQASLLPTSAERAANAAFYLMPLAIVVMAIRRLRRHRS